MKKGKITFTGCKFGAARDGSEDVVTTVTVDIEFNESPSYEYDFDRLVQQTERQYGFEISDRQRQKSKEQWKEYCFENFEDYQNDYLLECMYPFLQEDYFYTVDSNGIDDDGKRWASSTQLRGKNINGLLLSNDTRNRFKVLPFDNILPYMKSVEKISFNTVKQYLNKFSTI